MGLRSWLLAVGFCALSGAAWAEDGGGVAAPNRPAAAPVAQEQQQIRVGDVIMAPPVDPSPSDSSEAQREEEPWRPGLPRPRDQPQTRRWYGAKTLIIDAASAGLFTVGMLDLDDEGAMLMLIGTTTFVAGGPIVHGLQGHGWSALGSGLLRTSLPLTGGLIGLGGGSCNGDCGERILTGFALGAMSASLLDLALLHWERVEAPEPRSGAVVMPQVAVSQQQVLLGASGSF